MAAASTGRRCKESLGVLVPCQSAWNTPLLPVKKPHTNDYRPVQDLLKVNKRVADIHPTVPNPYTLLSSLAPSRVWYTVLDLKDAFFSLPLAPQSQPLFAFEWHDLEEGYSGQLTWTRLPQGFKNSPTIFDEALHEDLVFTDTFSGWVEAYPTKHETVQTVAKKLLEDILPSGLQRAHEDIWPHLRAIYEAGPIPTPHQYRPGDWVYVKRHHRETLEPCWKGPYIVVLTTPTALKVDGIATWVHHTHAQPADPSLIRKDVGTRWAISRDQHNLLKLKLQRIRPT
ncbi:uncharacterized protein LOC128773781 [Panthera pardus]|uniref:Uncharacterized protein LOC128773781 n=1 Tax=Panthera pardus TaxID=9691 RepID=A0A9W2UMG6_PANPR|nr:uncharacterized protein LOC128773781 [Panthera pardus]